jgi:hypothetical protein
MFGARYVINVRQTPWDRETMATMSGAFKQEIFALYRSSVVNARARVSKSAVKKIWLVAPAGIALAVIFFARTGGFGFTKAKTFQPVSGGVVAEGPAVAGSVSPGAAKAESAPVASLQVSDLQIENNAADLEPEKPLAVIVGKVEIGEDVVYLLKLKNRVVRVLAASLSDYELDGSL